MIPSLLSPESQGRLSGQEEIVITQYPETYKKRDAGNLGLDKCFALQVRFPASTFLETDIIHPPEPHKITSVSCAGSGVVNDGLF